MTFEEILKNRELELEKQNQLALKVIKLEKSLNNANKKLMEQQEKASTFDSILYPLIDEIKKRCGYEYADIYGPFGMTCETSIYFSHVGSHKSRNHLKCDSIDICDVDTWGLTLCPNDHYRSGYEYFTGETTNQYPEGTIGYLNGMNNIYKELPCDIDEIIKLLSFSKGKEA